MTAETAPRSRCRTRCRSSTSACRCSPTRSASRPRRCSTSTGGSRPTGELELVDALEQLYGPRAADDRRGQRRGGAPPGPGRAAAGRRRRRRETLVPGDVRTACCCTAGRRSTGPDVCDPLRRSMRAATVAEGWAETVEEADRMLADGAVRSRAGLPARHRACRWRPRSARRRRCSSSTTATAAPGRSPRSTRDPGETAWFGRETPAAIARLGFLRDVAGPDAAAGPRHRPGRSTSSRWPRRACRSATTCTCGPRARPTC